MLTIYYGLYSKTYNMQKQIYIIRIARLERLAELAREDKYVDKCVQAYRLLEKTHDSLKDLLKVNFRHI